MFNSKKGDFGVGLLIVVIGLIFVLGGVLYFFYVFKAHAALEARDEYIWNKVEEVPLDLLSMNIENESFVSRINKIYYGFIDMESTRIKLRDIIHKQLFYSYTTTLYPYEYFITIGGLSFTGQTGCTCNGQMFAHFTGAWTCSGGCGLYKDENCAKVWFYIPPSQPIYVPDSSKCFGKTEAIYNAAYPFPLTFNGTNNLITIISYEVAEWMD